MTAVPEESLASLYRLSRLAFDELMKGINASNVTTANLLAFEDECSRLQLWGMNIGAGQYNTSTSLDFRLRDAETIRHQLRKSLLELYDALQEACQSFRLLSQHGKMPMRFTQPSNEASPHESTMRRPSGAAARSDVDLEQTTQFLTIRSDPEGQLDITEAPHGNCEDETDDTNDPYEDLQYAFEDARSAINSLFRMTLYIRNPARRDQLKRRDISAVSGFAAFDEAHVEHKFPSASIDLTKRLGQANTVRRANIRYWERHHRKLALDEPSDDAATVAPLSESVATAFNPPPQEEDLEDTRSHFSGTSYMSSMLGGENTRRPDLPEAGRNGAPFQCPICYYLVTVSSEREWLKHVFFDLQPYVCLFSDCKTPLSLYENRHDWFNHVAAIHLPEKRNEVECPLCDDTVRTLPNIRRHLARHLEELALFSLPNSLFGEERHDLDDDNASVLSFGEDNAHVDPDLSTAEGKTGDLRINDNEPIMGEEEEEEEAEIEFSLYVQGFHNQQWISQTLDTDPPYYTDDEWEAQRAAFTRYYVSERRTLKSAAQRMSEDHSFYATPRQWARRAKDWRLTYDNYLEDHPERLGYTPGGRRLLSRYQIQSRSRSRSHTRRGSFDAPDAPHGSPTPADTRGVEGQSDEDLEADFAASDDERPGYRQPLRSSQERTRSAEHSETGDLAKGLSRDYDQETTQLEREAETRGIGMMLDEPSGGLEQSSGSGVNIDESSSTVSKDSDLRAPDQIHVKYKGFMIIIDFSSWSDKPATAKVGDLRNIVASKIAEDPARVLLIYRGLTMAPDSRLLRSYSIRPGGIVKAVVSERPINHHRKGRVAELFR